MPLGITLPASSHYTIRPAVEITASPFELLSSLDLTDRLLSLDITATKDEAASRATLTFSRGTGVSSLSPAVAASTLLVGGLPALSPGQWLHVFLEIDGFAAGRLWFGRIDRVNAAGKNTVTVTCRDFAATALNSVIRYAFNITGTAPVLDRLRAIANTARIQGSALDLTLNIQEPVATGWTMNPLLPQDSMVLMESFRQIVQTFGGDIRVVGRYGFDKLTIVPIDRVIPSGTVDATFNTGKYTDVTELTWGDEDVRNQWEGWYRDPATGVPVGPTYVEDAASMARYGPRYARIFLDRATNIDTSGEMETFLTAALADSKDPFASHRITLPLYPDVELDDVHNYAANGDEYDQNLTLAVVAYTHHWESTPGVQATTTIGARGSRIGAYREYRRSTPPKTVVTTVAPTTEYAPEGVVIYVKVPV